MGASFRNTDEILSLVGCDRLTISPALLSDLEASNGTLDVKLTDKGATATAGEPLVSQHSVGI